VSFYHDLILDHYKNPRNFGSLENPDIVVSETNASCGDEVEIFLTVNHEPLTIRQLRWRGRGCAISMAAASLLSERLRTMNYELRTIRLLADQDMVTFLGGEISSGRMRCVTLALTALQKALERSE
jgi:nitrogen fixation NifU-like protein